MSSAACANDSCSMRAMSSSPRPYDGLTVTAASTPEVSSRADTASRPSASTWNVTRMRAAPAAIGGIPRSSKRASERQSLMRSRSPCTTWIAIAVWPSLKVVNSCARDTGIVELRGTIFSASPPIVSRPSESGITSSSSQSSPAARLPARTLAWIAAPSATAWSGLRLVSGGAPKSSADGLLDLRHPRRAADHHHALDVGRLQPRIAQRAAHRRKRLGHEILRDRGEQLGGQRELDLVAGGQRRDDRRRRMQRQVFLGLARLDHQQPRVFGRQRRQPGRLDDPAIDAVIEIVAAQRGVAVGREHLEHAARELEDRDVERAAAEVVDGIDALRRIVEAVGDRRRGRLVQQAQHLDPRQPRGVLGRLALRVVEVRGNRHHRADEMAAQARLGALAQRAQDLRRDLDRALDAGAGRELHHARLVDEAIGKPAVVVQVGKPAAHQPLHRHDRVLRIDRLHRLRGHADVDAGRDRSGRSTAAADGRSRRAARPECRCAPSRPANWSCRDRCRPRACARAAPATRPVRKSAAAPSGFQLAQHVVDVGGELAQELQLAHPGARACPTPLRRRAAPQGDARARRLGTHVGEQSFQRRRVACRLRFARGLAPLELLFEKIERQRRIVSASASTPCSDSRYCARSTGSAARGRPR